MSPQTGATAAWPWDDAPVPAARRTAAGAVQRLNAAARAALAREGLGEHDWAGLVGGPAWRVVLRLPEQDDVVEVAGRAEHLPDGDVLAEAVRQAPVSLTVRDDHGQVVAANARARANAAAGALAADRSGGRDRARQLAQVRRRVERTGEWEILELAHPTAEGMRTTMNLQFPVRTASGTLVAGVGVDITSRVALEREVTRARDLAHEAGLLKDAFMSRMSHELRTPLTAILGFGELLQLSTALQEQDRRSADAVVDAGRAMLVLVDRLLDLARLGGRELPVPVQPAVLGDVVEAAHVAVRATAAAHQAELHRGDARGLVVLADPQRLQQVLISLLDNALRYGGGAVTTTFSPGPDAVAVHVDDTGPGLPAEARAGLFSAFERHHAGSGSGLGLALAHRLVAAMGGELTHADRLGGGTRFTVSLPAAPAPTAGGPSAHAVHGTVVYIEDNPGNVKLMERILLRWPHLTLVAAVRGLEGIALVERHGPAVVLLDLNLPDVHGSQVLDRLRSSPATRDTPVVVISADATLHQRRRAMELGARAYLTKPFVLTDVVAVLDDLLGPGGR